MIKKWEVTVPEQTGDALRYAYIYLPEGYEESDRRYPVLYMFDGHNVFFDSDATYGKSWGMGEYLDRTGTQLIVAAVECDHGEKPGRLSEYSPFDFCLPKICSAKGRGKITMDWFVNTFKPYVDANYRTLSDREHTLIAGSSMGGLMSLYAVTEYNSVFSRAACLSPSVWANNSKLMALLKTAEIAPGTVVYLDYGEVELKQNHGGIMRRLLEKTVKCLLERDVLLEFRIVPDGEHCEASWEKQIPFFMNTLFYGLE